MLALNLFSYAALAAILAASFVSGYAPSIFFSAATLAIASFNLGNELKALAGGESE